MGFILKALTSTLAVVSVVEAGNLLNFENEKDVVPGSYIVVMKDETSPRDFKTHLGWATNVHRRNLAKRESSSSTGMQFNFDIAGWRGYSGKFDSDTINEIVNHPNVRFPSFLHILEANGPHR